MEGQKSLNSTTKKTALPKAVLTAKDVRSPVLLHIIFICGLEPMKSFHSVLMSSMHYYKSSMKRSENKLPDRLVGKMRYRSY